MASINQFDEQSPAIIVDKVISLFNEKLGEQFLSETNHDSKEIIVSQIPENDKEELTQLILDQGYEVSFIESDGGGGKIGNG